MGGECGYKLLKEGYFTRVSRLENPQTKEETDSEEGMLNVFRLEVASVGGVGGLALVWH